MDTYTLYVHNTHIYYIYGHIHTYVTINEKKRPWIGKSKGGIYGRVFREEREGEIMNLYYRIKIKDQNKTKQNSENWMLNRKNILVGIV